MKVFISSVISGYEEYRAAVQEAVETLGHEVIRAEDFGASSSSPRVACLAGVRQADLVILLLGSRYGAVQASGLSATHEEFKEAQNRKEVIAFIEDVAHREDAQMTFLNEVQDWQGGLFTQTFSDASSLHRAVIKAMHDRLLAEARGTSDESEIRERTLSLLPEEERGWSRSTAELVISIAGGPRQNLLRPIQIEGDDLDRETFRLALQGPNAVFDRREGTDRELVDNTFTLRQRSRSLTIHSDGSIILVLPIQSESRLGALIEEDVWEQITRAIGFFNDVLSFIDSTERLRHICIAVSIKGADYTGWRTRDQERSSPSGMTINMHDEKKAVATDVWPRASLRTRKAEIAEDLTVLLRRQFSR